MAKYLYMSIIFRTFVANNKAYDRGRVNQRNTAEETAFGT
jgi:hypothetical protein